MPFAREGWVQMAVFVLVHGAWGGAHGFRKVRGPLREAGHEVFTPSLTGIGERAHLTSPQVNLTTHVADVVNAVWYEDLSDIVLLGYSYGGAVVTGALEYIGDRVRHLVYLDAFVPGDGDTVAGLGGAAAESGLAALGRDWLVPPLPREYDDPAEAAWAGPRRSPAPTSRPPASPGPLTGGRSGPPRTGPWPRRPGATGRSPPTT